MRGDEKQAHESTRRFGKITARYIQKIQDNFYSIHDFVHFTVPITNNKDGSESWE